MKTIIIILIFLFQSVSAFSQNDKQIASIDSTVLGIKNNIGNYKQEIKKWEDSSNNIRIIYRLKKTVKYCTFSYNDNNLLKSTYYYFSNGHLIFAETIWTDANLQIVYNEKYYLENGHLIQWINEDKKIVEKDSKEFKDMDKELSDVSKSWEKDAK